MTSVYILAVDVAAHGQNCLCCIFLRFSECRETRASFAVRIVQVRQIHFAASCLLSPGAGFTTPLRLTKARLSEFS